MDINDFLEIGKIKSKSVNFLNKFEDTIKLCQAQLRKFDNPYVAVSGGKDSNVLAYIVSLAAARENKDISIWSHISDASFPDTEKTIIDVYNNVKNLGNNNIKLDISKCPFSAIENLKNSKQKQRFGKTGVFYTDVRKYAANKNLAFVGVRSYESKRRMKAAKVHGCTFYSKSMGNINTCYPLLWWKLEDIAAATVLCNIPLHPIYYKMPINLGKNVNGEDIFIRLGYITSRDLLDRGTAVFLKNNYPDIFFKLAENYPDILLNL